MTPEQAAWTVLMIGAAIVLVCITGAAEWLARRYPPFGDWVERLVERITR